LLGRADVESTWVKGLQPNKGISTLGVAV
jgi:hypothetical protein